MPIIDKYAPGSFCWAELATTDTAAARAFYRDLLGWDFRDPEASLYTIVRVQGQQAGGIYALTAEQKGQGVPPHWLVYFSVTNADQSAAKATALGGKIVAGPSAVEDLGRMAMLEDPTGAKFCIWQASALAGAGIVNELGAPTWPELATREPLKAASFYSQLLGWDTRKSDNPMVSYTEWQLGGESIGGMMEMDSRWGEAPPHWMIYVMVSDCRQVCEKAAAIGGKIHHPPMDIPNAGRIAVVADPQGAVFAIIQLSGKQA
jgi:predicted enzyme related to lactoylglutathione lyase